ncbi:MAG TPA: FliH/SctL family protein [Terriglobia bacterium]|nr:FliH/SctL family protein [Terriglobia bacterium]
MSSRIIRGDSRAQRLKISSPSERSIISAASQEQAMNIEKEAFEQGYAEGERIGKQMGEKMIETVVKRYDNSVAQLAESHKQLVESMEEQTVRLALEIARKIVQRELTMDQDLVAALASVALKRVSGHQDITLRVSRHDFGRVRVVVGNVNPAVTVKDDASLERGDFVVETGQTFLDGRVSTQIDALGKALFDE